MNKHQVKGLTNQATGEVKERVGRALGDREMEAKGHLREIKGKAQEKLGNTKEVLKDDEKELSRRERQMGDDDLER